MGDGFLRPSGEIIRVDGIFSLRTDRRHAAKSPYSHAGKQDNTQLFCFRRKNRIMLCTEMRFEEVDTKYSSFSYPCLHHPLQLRPQTARDM